MELKDFCINRPCTVIDVLRKIEEGGKGMIFVTSKEMHLLGVVTDGDIRRALLDEVSLHDSIDTVLNPKPIAYSLDSPLNTLIKAASQYRVIPLLDEEGKLLDYFTLDHAGEVPIANPKLDGNELSYVTECITSNWISSHGRFVTMFEEYMAELTGLEHTLSVCNGTVALQLALSALGIGKGDEVIIPDLTFGATANAVLAVGANPVFVDVHLDTWNINIDHARKAIGSNTRAIIPVDLYGNPAAIQEVVNFAAEFDLRIIHDCAESIGATDNGKHVGYFADACTFSFFANKIVTAGEGGMIGFKNRDDAERARMLRDHGMTPERRYYHSEPGFNYRLTNMQAAVACAQIEKLEEKLLRRDEISQMYMESLSEIQCIEYQVVNEDSRNVNWLFTIRIEDICIESLQLALRKSGIDTRRVFIPLSTMPAFSKFDSYLDGSAMKIHQSGISLPTYVGLTKSDIAQVSHKITKFLQEEKVP